MFSFLDTYSFAIMLFLPPLMFFTGVGGLIYSGVEFYWGDRPRRAGIVGVVSLVSVLLPVWFYLAAINYSQPVSPG